MTLNILVSVIVAFFYIGWMPPSQLSSIVIYVAVANFIISILSLGTLPPGTPREDQKYFVKKINGAEFGSVIVSEQDFQDIAIYNAYELAKRNADEVFVVVDTHGNRIATINNSDVSIQIHNNKSRL